MFTATTHGRRRGRVIECAGFCLNGEDAVANGCTSDGGVVRHVVSLRTQGFSGFSGYTEAEIRIVLN
jgi:hypothetical protein